MNLDPLDVWRRAMVDSVRRDAADLSARQMAVLLTVYMTQPPHTVRGLAELLNVSKPAITRALDRLGELSLARRKTDPKDRRSVVVQRTVKGSVYLAEFAEIISAATEQSAREIAAKASRQAQRKAKKAESAKPAKAPARGTQAMPGARSATASQAPKPQQVPAKEPAGN